MDEETRRERVVKTCVVVEESPETGGKVVTAGAEGWLGSGHMGWTEGAGGCGGCYTCACCIFLHSAAQPHSCLHSPLLLADKTTHKQTQNALTLKSFRAHPLCWDHATLSEQ